MKNNERTRMMLFFGLMLSILVLCGFCTRLEAQVTLTPSLNTLSSTTEFRWGVQAELQASNVAVNVGWSPIRKTSIIHTDGFSLGMTWYYYAYRTSPYVEFKILTYGKANLSDVTGEATRSEAVIIGVRVFPVQIDDDIIDRISFNIGAGVNLKENLKVEPCVTISANFTLLK